MDKTATTESATSTEKTAPPQSKNGKQSPKQARNPYEGKEKTGKRLDRHVSKRSQSEHIPLLVTTIQTEMPMTVEVYTDFGAQACAQFLPAYDEAVSFLYQYVQRRMKPAALSAQRADELARLIDAHQRFSMAHELIDTRTKALEAKLANAGVDFEDALEKKAVSRTITVSNPHLVKYYEGIHKADRLVLILELAWISGVITTQERGSDFWSIKRAIEREYNFIERIYQTCQKPNFFNPFKMFNGVKRRLDREAHQAEEKAKAESKKKEKGKAKKADGSAAPSETDKAEKAPAKKAKPKASTKNSEAKPEASSAKKATSTAKKTDKSESKKSDEQGDFDEGDVMQALG